MANQLPPIQGDLKGQKVVVIGGSAGIGQASAARAYAAGAELAISARGAERLEKAAKDLMAAGGRPVAHEIIDMRDRAMVAAYLKRHAPFDHLLLPGAGVYRTTYDDLDEEKARLSIDAKFWGQFWSAYDARHLMPRGGSITFYSGVANRRPVPGYVIGAVIDGALDGCTRALAHELAPLKIRVNTISPGVVASSFVERISPEVKKSLFDAYAAKVPVKRVGESDDCAQAAMYLMTTAFVTGQVLRVDGGAESVP
jgi:NAD(P)-dependent dehydrogenase (short-subunit alcohol dehydrogenase family)